MQFEKMTKIPRLGNKRDIMIITEKIDGTNAQLMIDEDLNMIACSKNRQLLGTNDNYGFRAWAELHEQELVDILGPGRHYGEWWGSKIQRAYGRTNGERHFSIFDTRRPIESLRAPVEQVPWLYYGPFSTTKIREVMADLYDQGSLLCDYWFKPEGIVVNHIATGQLYKVTYDYKNGKWAEK